MTENITSIKNSTPPVPASIATESPQTKQSTALDGKEASTDTPSATRLPQLQKLKDVLAKPFRVYSKVQMVSVGRKEIDYHKNRYGMGVALLYDDPNTPRTRTSEVLAAIGKLEAAETLLKGYEEGSATKMKIQDGAQFRQSIQDFLHMKKALFEGKSFTLHDKDAQVKEGVGSRFSKRESVYRGLKQLLSGLFAGRRITTREKAENKIESLKAQIENLDNTRPRKEYPNKGNAIAKAFDSIGVLNKAIREAKNNNRNELNKTEIKNFRKEFRDLEVLIRSIEKKNW